MTRALLVEATSGGTTAHDAELLPSPRHLAAALSPAAWRILSALAQRPDYAGGLARRLGLHEQRVYYHVHRLMGAGLLRVVREEGRRGAPRRYLAPTAQALAVKLLPRAAGTARVPPLPVPEVLDFFSDLCPGGVLRAPIVVGSPVPHGPFLTAARDGHYAVALGFHLGALAAPGVQGVVTLDTDVRALGLQRGPLILVGGPVANLLSMEINPHLPARFDWREGWRIVGEGRGRVFTSEGVGLVAKVPNPWAPGHWVVLLSGLHHQGTQAAIAAVTSSAREALAGYQRGTSMVRVVEGLDRDGDGRPDSVAVLQ